MDMATPQRLLSEIEGCLDRFDAASVRAGERLACSQRVRALASRMTALSAALLAEADAASESLREAGTPTTSWLTTRGGLSKREAAGVLHQARELRQRPAVGEAAMAGEISVTQARTIGRVLDGLTGLSEAQTARAEQFMVSLAERQDCDQLAKAAPAVLAAVAPERGTEGEERRLQRQAEAAQRNRSLVFGRDGAGSVTFSGSLPQLAGEAFLTLVDSYVESRRRNAVEERDPACERRTPAQRRADGLLDLVASHERRRQAPPSGGDRPRVMVTLDYEQLRRTAAGAGLIADGQRLSAGELRRVCCDADLVPVVLGGPSEMLDVGRERRLVTPPIRAALALRDRGCVFPGCQTRAAACEAHHLEPWWAGGATALSNLALLCRHHHALVEPAKFAARDQWELQIAADGVPEAIPPWRYDHERRPLRHARFADPIEPGDTNGESTRPPPCAVSSG